MGDSLPKLESGNGRKSGWLILLRCLSCKRDRSWGGICRVHGHLVCNSYIRQGCRGTRKTWVRRGYKVIHMVLGLLETVILNGSKV